MEKLTSLQAHRCPCCRKILEESRVFHPEGMTLQPFLLPCRIKPCQGLSLLLVGEKQDDLG